MRFNIISDESDLSIEMKGKIGKDQLEQFSDILDHAALVKSDVKYQQSDNCLTLKLERNEFEKKKKKFLWFNLWAAGIYPTKKCILIIRDVDICNIRDEDPKTTEKQKVLIGGVHFSDNKIYIGSFCERDNAYGITLKIKRLNITLEDL